MVCLHENATLAIGTITQCSPWRYTHSSMTTARKRGHDIDWASKSHWHGRQTQAVVNEHIVQLLEASPFSACIWVVIWARLLVSAWVAL